MVVIVGSKPRHVGCEVEGCESKHHSHGYCSVHSARFKAHGDALAEPNYHAGRNRVDAPSYDGMHKRLFYDRGKARDYSCVDCGGQADEWSYDGGCPNELYEVKVLRPIAYSVDQSRYSPRCRPCHRPRDESLNKIRDAHGKFLMQADARMVPA